ncbi:MAG TPA: ATP-dependent DNA helicase [Candidatus Limnocylindrales bacterium]|nr:ATP-dependent DNA helicase [Candidatus Limnocylindrales bacterium]
MVACASFSPNPKQKEAIEHVLGPMLVLAGAGTGKTTVLVERIAWLISQRYARPEEVLAITFTENAAHELKTRVEKRLGRRAPITACTFHAYCYGVLKRNGEDFHALPPEDVYVFLRQRISELQLERFIKPADLGQFLHDLRDFFDRCHEELIGPEKFAAYVASLNPGADLPRNCRSKQVEELGPQEVLERWREIARVYGNVLRLLEQENVGTFGMMISGAVRLLQSRPGLLEEERRRARFILIDEFQDCNASNITLAELLGGEEKNIFAVGDPDQAIYRFRGASSAAFEDFQARFPQTKGVVLAENQRSRGNILRVAFSAIAPNPSVRSAAAKVQFERKPLESGRDRREKEEGRLVFDEPVEAVISPSDGLEAADIAERILSLRGEARTKDPLKLAVLYRSHVYREKIIEELAARDIPFIVKGVGVLETPVARDLLSVIRAVVNDGDADSVFRVCALPQFKVSPDELRQKLAAAGRDNTFKSVLQLMETGQGVLAAIQRAREFIAGQKLAAAGATRYLAREFGFPAGDPAVRALQRFVADWEKKPFITGRSLEAFLEYLALFQEGGGVIPLFTDDELAEAEEENPGAVRLMTVHAAKGLEFDHVWLLRVISPGFPASYKEPLFEFPPALRSTIVLADSKEVNEQEERRLFYVAITRARDRLAIHSRPGRGQDRTPPGFLRPLLQSKVLNGSLWEREAARLGRALPKAQAEISPVSEWMLLPPAVKVEDLALSANAVESYSTCPLKFKLERDWKIPGEAAVAMQYGSAIHTVLRQYYDPAPHARAMSADDVVEAFRKEFGKAVVDDPLQRELYERQGAGQLRALLASRPKDSLDVLAAEVRFEFMLNGKKIVGRMDRVDRIEGNTVRVVDYKTGAAKTQRYADDSLQLSIYSMGATAMGFQPRELVFVNLQGTQEVLTFRTPYMLEKARRRIDEAAQGIAAGRFGASPGPHCVWCDYRKLCPATEQRVFLPVNSLTKEKETKVAGAQG